jgi:hypothetical protein
MDQGFSKYKGEFFLGDEFGEMEYHVVPFLSRFKIVFPALKEIDIFKNQEISDFTEYSEKCQKNKVFLATSYNAVPANSPGLKGYLKTLKKEYNYEQYLIDSYLIYLKK